MSFPDFLHHKFGWGKNTITKFLRSQARPDWTKHAIPHLLRGEHLVTCRVFENIPWLLLVVCRLVFNLEHDDPTQEASQLIVLLTSAYCILGTSAPCLVSVRVALSHPHTKILSPLKGGASKRPSSFMSDNQNRSVQNW